jgi:hypothetical protein
MGDVVINSKETFEGRVHNRICFPSCSIVMSSDMPCRPIVEVEVEVNLRPTVSRPVCLGVRRPSGTRDQFFFLLRISFRQLRVCHFVAPSLTRGRVCNLLVKLLLGLARAVTLGSNSRRTHDHILLSHLRLPQPGGPDPRIYIPQEQGGPVIPPGTVFRPIVWFIEWYSESECYFPDCWTQPILIVCSQTISRMFE